MSPYWEHIRKRDSSSAKKRASTIGVGIQQLLPHFRREGHPSAFIGRPSHVLHPDWPKWNLIARLNIYSRE